MLKDFFCLCSYDENISGFTNTKISWRKLAAAFGLLAKCRCFVYEMVKTKVCSWGRWGRGAWIKYYMGGVKLHDAYPPYPSNSINITVTLEISQFLTRDDTAWWICHSTGSARWVTCKVKIKQKRMFWDKRTLAITTPDGISLRNLLLKACMSTSTSARVR